ncbi:MAG: ATP-binding protein [Bacteroidales bacterium]|nr:ATP-binding protein [Bacteroidales bacterium]
MKRTKIAELISWKDSTSRKPLIIRGARQVGKTWLMKEFGRIYYENTVYLNIEKTKRLETIVKDDFDIQRIILALEVESGVKIDPANTLIILDEIQAIPKLITALKYFCEDAPQFHIMAAGSLLGMAIHSNVSFPVGKVQFLDLYPLSFIEYLEAFDEVNLVEMLSKCDWKLITAFKSKFIEHLKHYYFVGGMPEAVSHFVVNRDFNEIRSIHKQILYAYEQDFSKHAPVSIVPRIRMVWNSIPSQLAKENRKFIYGLIKEGSRAKDYELALTWLNDCGQVHKINRAVKPFIPLKAYEDFSAFKMFLVDIGLLAAMGDIDPKTIIEGNAIFTEFKGALTEQYVLQQMVTEDLFKIFYWSAERSSAEVDFIIQFNGLVLPVEVKAEENLHAKSLRVFHEKFAPKLTVRTSMSDYRLEEWLINLPLYAISSLKRIANK